MHGPLTSTANPLVKRLARLGEARVRREEGLFLVEGRRAIDGFLRAGVVPAHLLLRDGEAIPEGWPEPQRASAHVLERLSLASTPSGFVAAFPIPVPPALDRSRGGLVLAEVSDPGNVGTLARTAAALGVAQLAVVGGADPWSPKAVQASAGALARLAVHRLEPESGLAPLVADGDAGAPLCALVARGGEPPERLPRRPRWVVVGGEAHGLPDAWLASCSERLTLPMPGGTESLNAAIAGAIACWLLLREPA